MSECDLRLISWIMVSIFTLGFCFAALISMVGDIQEYFKNKND